MAFSFTLIQGFYRYCASIRDNETLVIIYEAYNSLFLSRKQIHNIDDYSNLLSYTTPGYYERINEGFVRSCRFMVTSRDFVWNFGTKYKIGRMIVFYAYFVWWMTRCDEECGFATRQCQGTLPLILLSRKFYKEYYMHSLLLRCVFRPFVFSWLNNIGQSGEIRGEYNGRIFDDSEESFFFRSFTFFFLCYQKFTILWIFTYLHYA